MEKITQSAVVLALVASVAYGIGGPFMRVALMNGTTPSGIILMYGFAGFVVSLNYTGGQTVLFGNLKGLVFAAITGLLFGIGMVASSRSMSLPSGHVSLVTALVASYPLISILIGLSVMGESSKMMMPRLIFGAILIIAGTILVATSTKPAV